MKKKGLQTGLEGKPIVTGQKEHGIKVSKRRMKEKELYEKRSLALMVLAVASDPKNYQILIMLPTTVKSIMGALGITKMPANTRINELKNMGLLGRRKGTGRIYPTDVGIYIKNVINTINRDIENWGRNAIIDEDKIKKIPVFDCSRCRHIQAYQGKGKPHCIACGTELEDKDIIDYILLQTNPSMS